MCIVGRFSLFSCFLTEMTKMSGINAVVYEISRTFRDCSQNSLNQLSVCGSDPVLTRSLASFCSLESSV